METGAVALTFSAVSLNLRAYLLPYSASHVTLFMAQLVAPSGNKLDDILLPRDRVDLQWVLNACARHCGLRSIPSGAISSAATSRVMASDVYEWLHQLNNNEVLGKLAWLPWSRIT